MEVYSPLVSDSQGYPRGTAEWTFERFPLEAGGNGVFRRIRPGSRKMASRPRDVLQVHSRIGPLMGLKNRGFLAHW